MDNRISDGARPIRAGRRKKCDKAEDFKKPYKSAGPACHGPCEAGDVWDRERMEGQADSLRVAEDVMLPKAKDGLGQQKEKGKPSLRKRLKIAEEKSHRMHGEGSLREPKSRIGERQR